MDKNTVVGLLLIGAILIGFSIYNSPSRDEIAIQKHYRDSIAAITKVNQKVAVQKPTVPRQKSVSRGGTGTQKNLTTNLH